MFFRPTSIFLTLSFLALVSLIYIFENKVDEQNSLIRQTNANIIKYREDIAVYEAEWSYQNTPQRLCKLMSGVKKKDNMKEAGFYQFADLMNLKSEILVASRTTKNLVKRRKVAEVKVRRIPVSQAESIFNLVEGTPASMRN